MYQTRAGEDGEEERGEGLARQTRSEKGCFMNEKIFEHHMLVRQEHLNQYGGLFGGVVLATIDELAFIACARTFPGRNFLTRAVQNAEFSAAAALGDILEFTFHVEKVGTSSVTVHVRMAICQGSSAAAPATAFDGRVVLVCVDAERRPTPVEK